MDFISILVAPIGIIVTRSMASRITRNSKTVNKTEARQIYEAEKIDALRGQSNLPKKFVSFNVLCDRYLEWSKIHKRSHSHDIINRTVKLKFCLTISIIKTKFAPIAQDG